MSGISLSAHLIRPQENHDDIPLLPLEGCTTSHFVSKIIMAASRCNEKIFCRSLRCISWHLLPFGDKKNSPGNQGELIRLAIYTVGRVMYCSLLNLTGLDMRLDPVWLTASTNIGLSASAIDYISHD
jgi:hypothetical protein